MSHGGWAEACRTVEKHRRRSRRLDPLVPGVAVFTGTRLLDLGKDVLETHTLADVLEAVAELEFLEVGGVKRTSEGVR